MGRTAISIPLGLEKFDLKVIETGLRLGRHTAVKILCRCGRSKVVMASHVNAGTVKSCGCRRRTSRHNVTHGKSNSKTYVIWKHLKETKNLCSRWSSSFSNFLQDVGEATNERPSLHLIDSRKPYEPGNARWGQRKIAKELSYSNGDKVGGWTVVGAAEKVGKHNAVHVACECGFEKVVPTHSLRYGKSRSCGCRRRLNKPSLTHGKTGAKEYRAWSAMKRRCYDPKCRGYKDYGGRGIEVADVWRNSFSAFFESVGAAPSAGHTIERINTNWHYEPGNVKWATKLAQANNKRTNTYVKLYGETITLSEAARKYGVDYHRLRARYVKGMPIQAAVEVPMRPRDRQITSGGVTKNITEWGRAIGVAPNTIHARIKNGYSPEDAVKFGKGGDPGRWRARGHGIKNGDMR